MLAALTLGEPVVFVIRSINGAHRLHWVSAWGYDPAADEFLVYDSQAPTALGAPCNVRYSAALLCANPPFRGTFVLTIDI